MVDVTETFEIAAFDLFSLPISQARETLDRVDEFTVGGEVIAVSSD